MNLPVPPFVYTCRSLLTCMETPAQEIYAFEPIIIVIFLVDVISFRDTFCLPYLDDLQSC